jgi:hypothetical protein
VSGVRREAPRQARGVWWPRRVADARAVRRPLKVQNRDSSLTGVGQWKGIRRQFGAT